MPSTEVDTRIRARIEQAAELVDQTDGLIVAAGAGKGVDFGLPDFCGAARFWEAYPALPSPR